MSVCHFPPIILVNCVFWQGQGVSHSAFAPTVIVLGGTLPVCSWVVLDSAASLRLSALFCSSCNKKKSDKKRCKSPLWSVMTYPYLASVVVLVSPVGLPSTARGQIRQPSSIINHHVFTLLSFTVFTWHSRKPKYCLRPLCLFWD